MGIRISQSTIMYYVYESRVFLFFNYLNKINPVTGFARDNGTRGEKIIFRLHRRG